MQPFDIRQDRAEIEAPPAETRIEQQLADSPIETPAPESRGPLAVPTQGVVIDMDLGELPARVVTHHTLAISRRHAEVLYRLASALKSKRARVLPGPRESRTVGRLVLDATDAIYWLLDRMADEAEKGYGAA